MSRVRCVLVGVVVVAAAAAALAQDGGVVARYPAAAKVAADYADDAERYAALKILYDDLGEKTAGTRVPGKYDKESAYFSAFQSVTAKYMDMKKGSPELEKYSGRVQGLLSDAAFRRSVVEKYGVADIQGPPPPAAAAPAPASASAPAQAPGDVTDAMIQAACLRALPFVLASLAAAAVVSKLLLRGTERFPSVGKPPTPPPPGVPPLPESLHVIALPGLEYTIDVASGIVIEKESTSHTSSHTTTTPGQPYAVGNEIHFTPGQTQTSSSTVQTDVIWVRTPQGREEAWTFTGGTFKARRGQVISVVTRPMRDGSPRRMIAYNHETDQLEEYAGVALDGGPRSGPAWWAAWAIGSVGFGIGFGILLSIGPDPISGPIGWFTAWLFGAMTSVVATFAVLAFVSRGVGPRKVARYRDHYLPQIRSYLVQCGPALRARLGAG